MTDASPTSATDITESVIRRYDGCADPRLREIMQALVAHLHGFVTEVALTPEEWAAAIGVLTATGHITDERRQEFILWSDTLGVSMLVDALANPLPAGATESTVLGPFYVEGSPWRSNGDAITGDLGTQPLLVSGHVRDTAGRPLSGATVDVWQNATNRLYAVQDGAQSPENLRGRFHTDVDGAFAFRTVRPVDYPIPDDGPVGRMLQATRRHPWRPAHIHFMVSADGCIPVTTHVFDSASPYLESDVVFGVKQSLVRTLVEHDPAVEPVPAGVNGRWYTVDVDIALSPAS